MKVYLHPQPKPVERLNSGVDVVVHKMYAHLPAHGVELVRERERADVVAVHICPPQAEPVDVLHCHGLYPTAQRQLDSWCWEVNARISAAVRTAPGHVAQPLVAELFAAKCFVPRVVPHGLDIAVAERERHPTPTVLWNKNRSRGRLPPAPLNELAKAAPDFKFVATFGDPAHNVAITGVLPHAEMRDLLYQVGIYFAPTKETFGIGILEALAAGVPVLAWRWGNAPELVAHRENGYLVDPYDVDGAREGLRYILDHYAELSAKARQSALRYDWPAIAGIYADIYAAALDQQAREREGLVSIIIPCHNYAAYVGRAIESVKAQTYGPWECIVVDDGSTDGSLEAARAAIGDDPRFQLLTQSNQRVAYTRNRGAHVGRGQYLMFLDADDWLYPDALERLVPALAADRRLGLVYGKLSIANEAGEIGRRVGDWPGPFDLHAQMNKQNQVPSCNLLRREAFLRTGGFRAHAIPCEDAELWSRLPLVGYEIRQATTEPVYVYRLHGASASAAVRGKGEPDWSAWLAPLQGAKPGFACVAAPKGGLSHPVYDYDQPLVSFVIPCGEGHQDLLVDALESLAYQTDVRWEAIVVDDTRDGNLAEHGMLPYREAYPWVRWLRAEKRGNVSASRNQGARAARGPYLCFLDADDYLLRDFIERVWLVLKECSGDAVLCYTDWVEDPAGRAHQAANWNVARLLEQALFAVTFVHPKSAWRAVGGFDETLSNWEDWDYTIKLGLEGYKGVRVPKPLFVYRYGTGKRREAALQDQEALLAQIRGRYVAQVPKPRRG
jgi:glycosyltransferase involved in cell wall biosynthesis